MAKKGVQVGVELTAENKGYKKGMEDAKKATADFNKTAKQQARESEQQFKQVTMAVAKIAAGIVVAQQAFVAYEKIMRSTSGTADSFDATMGGLSAATDKFLSDIARSDFKNFIQGLRDARDAGEEYIKALDQINERTLGLTLNKSTLDPEQVGRMEIFKDRNADPAERQNALNEYKKVAIALAQKELSIAQARVKAEGDYLKGQGIEAERIKFLYDNYNDNLEVINKVGDAIARGRDIQKQLFAEASRLIPSNKKINELGEQMLAIKESLSAEERVYFNALMSNDQAKQENIDKYVKALIDENKAKANIGMVDVENLRIQTNITNELKDQTEEINKQRKVKDINFGGDFAQTEDASRLMGSYGLAGAPKATTIPEDFSQTEEALKSLQGTFADLFMTIGDGWQAVGDSIIATMRRIMAEMAAKAAMFILLDILSGGTGTIAKAAAGLKGTMFPTGGLIGGLNNNNQIGGLNLTATVKGEDMLFAVTRANEKLGRNT